MKTGGGGGSAWEGRLKGACEGGWGLGGEAACERGLGGACERVGGCGGVARERGLLVMGGWGGVVWGEVCCCYGPYRPGGVQTAEYRHKE